MNLRELFFAGRLSEAIAAQQASVRARPADADARWALAVLLAFAGELDRAALQLDALIAQDAGFAPGVATYRSLLTAEAERLAVHRREGQPLLPPDCPAHVETRVEALGALRGGDVESARKRLEQAEAERPDLEGKLNGEPFAELSDQDDLLAPVLEVYAGGRYLWLPLERVRRVEVAPPAHLADLLWPRAVLEDSTGVEASVHLPALYAGSHAAADERVRCGVMTEWALEGELLYRGLGQRTLLAARGGEPRELPLRELRSLEIAAEAAGAQA